MVMASSGVLSLLFRNSDSDSVNGKTKSDVDCNVLSTGLANNDFVALESERVSDALFLVLL